MSVESHRVLIGACGWKHAAWLDEFYSDDLPEDWQLGFYSNEFPVVYVSAGDWVDEANLDEWIEDISDDFRFILQVPAEALNNESRFAALLTNIKKLGEHCLGIVFELNQSICDDSHLLDTCLTQAQAITLVCIERNDLILSDDCKALLTKKNIAEVGDGITETIEAKGAQLAITHISSENLNMTMLRAALEICLKASNEDCVSVLCIDGDPPSLEVLRNADILLNLL